MAWDDFYDLPDNFRDEEAFQNDPYLRGLTEFLFGEDGNSEYRAHGDGFKTVLAELQAHVYDNYGIDFDDVFEWDDWRNWYDGA
jgi:hypothetical protein